MLWALAAFILVPLLPTALRPVVPIAETIVLVVAAMAACAVIGWWKGGSIFFALVWVALLGWMLLTQSAGVGGGNPLYGMMVRGWVLVLVGAFGVASLLTPNQVFTVRALAAVGMTAMVAFTLTVLSPQGVERIHQVVLAEYESRSNEMIREFEDARAVPEVQRFFNRIPGFNEMAERNEAWLRTLPAKGVEMLPAFLALESLAALALGWAVYHRISPVRIGPLLGPVRDFRFNDQLIWGLAVGATIFFLPPFAEGKSAGLNLLIFFGALYLLRGVGVLSWVTGGRTARTVLIVLTAIQPLITAALALVVGVGDTWMDWRNRTTPAN